MLDQYTICVDAPETTQIDQLDKLGLEVIPVEFADVSPFGGGLHCATADVYRDGTCEDYFPHQLPGF
jgi:glycine amidinotransferase